MVDEMRGALRHPPSIANRQRLKVWAESTIIEAEQDVELSRRLEMPDYEARIERLVILAVQAYDWNCPQHITPRYTEEEFQALLPV